MEEKDHEYYVSPEVAKLLKEAGFDWNCYELYECENEKGNRIHSVTSANWNASSKYYSAPTLEVVQKWLREVKGISAESGFLKPGEWGSYVLLNINKDTYEERTLWDREFNHETYEEALETSIKKALEIILEKGE